MISYKLLSHLETLEPIKMKTNFIYRHVFTAINILYKFGENIFINEQEKEFYVKK